MSRGIARSEGLLLLALLVGLLLHVGLRPDYGRRNLEYMPNMAETPGYEAQDPNPVFADGTTLQTPPAGTIARGAMPLSDAAGPLPPGGAWDKLAPGLRARWDALGPAVPFDELEQDEQAARLARGKHVFENVCATCHGLGGLGGTPVTKRGVPPPPRFDDPKLAGYTQGHLLHVILFGKGNMPSHANHVTRKDRWMLIRYVQTLLAAKP